MEICRRRNWNSYKLKGIYYEKINEEEIIGDYDIPDEVFEMDKKPIADMEKSKKDDSNKNDVLLKNNYHYNLWEIEKGGAKTRYKWNVEAIKTLKRIEKEERIANMEEQKILSRYAGWGGLSEVFDEKNNLWKDEYREIKELLTHSEYDNARASVNNAFYTSPEIAMCINQKISNLGISKGNILEPSMGIGNFFGSMPASMNECKLYGVEIDEVTGRIAKQLYQTANITISGFEETNFNDNFLILL